MITKKSENTYQRYQAKKIMFNWKVQACVEDPQSQ